MDFSVNTPQPRAAFCTARLEMLRQLLHLPDDVRITKIEMDAGNPMACRIYLAGYSLPADGELTPQYRFEKHPIVKFAGWSQP